MNHTANNSTVSRRVTCAHTHTHTCTHTHTLPHIITLLSHVIPFYASGLLWFRIFAQAACIFSTTLCCCFVTHSIWKSPLSVQSFVPSIYQFVLQPMSACCHYPLLLFIIIHLHAEFHPDWPNLIEKLSHTVSPQLQGELGRLLEVSSVLAS